MINITKQICKFNEDKDIKEFCLKCNDVNIFSALKIENTEIYHSNMIAWLFNPYQTHGLKNKFFQYFLKNCHLEDIDAQDIKRVRREHENTDILLEGTNWCIVIENKIYSMQHSNQLKRYEETIQKEFSDIKKFYFIYLKPRLNELLPSSWKYISYDIIYRTIKDVLQKEKLSEKVKFFLTQYLETIAMFTENDEAKELYLQLYLRYKSLFDKVFEYKENEQKSLKQILEDIIIAETKNLGIHPLDSTNAFVRFCSSEMNKKELCYSENWVEEKNIILFEFQNKKDELLLDVVVGHTGKKNENKRNNLIRYLCNKLGYSDNDIKNYQEKKWAHIYSECILSKEEYWNNRSDIKEFKKRIKNSITKLVKKFDNYLSCYKDEQKR